MSAGAETTGCAREGLYRRLVREGWDGLDAPVRRFHERGGGRASARGTFAVRRGRGLAARALARLLRLPRGGEAVPLRLSVEPLAGGGELWRRAFDGREFVTVQRGRGRLLAERAGPFELLFRLAAEGGALAYRQEGAGLCAWRLRVRLPRAFAPRVEASERACEGGGVRVRVRVAAPLVGLVVEYEGTVTAEEGEG
ncbi:MAG TPA: DUF4166 domain-containing protein [Pyrinomonadaceae bacterium]